MHANVPQFIDIEDKIAFGLTGKQLIWMAAMVTVLIFTYSLFDRELFFASGFFIVVIFGAFAFWRPQGVSLITFSGYTLMFFLKPKSYIWKRIYHHDTTDLKKAALVQRKNAPAPIVKKHLPGGRSLKQIAWELDTRK